MSGSNPLAAALGQVGSTNPLQYAAGYADLATKAQALKANQFSLGQAQLQPGYSAIRMLQATNPNPSDDDVNAALGAAARQPNSNVDPIVQDYTAWRARGGSPADFVRSRAIGGMSPENQAAYSFPQRQNVQTAAGLYTGTMGALAGPNAGQFTPGTFVGQGVSPEWAAGREPVVGPNGQVQMVPRGALAGPNAVPAVSGVTPIGAGAATGGGGTGVGSSALLPPGAPADVAAARIDQIAQRESGGQNIPNRMGPGGTPLSSASGPYQFLDSTWQQAAREYGIPNPTQRAMDTDPAIQRAVAIQFLQRHGEAPWATSAPGGGGAVTAGPGGQQGPFIGATSAQPVAGAGANVRPAGGGGVTYVPASPGAGGGGGATIPGVGGMTPYGAVLTPPSPYMAPQWEQSTKDYVADQVANKTLSRRIAPLQNAINIIKENPGLVTGPSSENWYQWVQGIAAATGIDVGDVHNANAYNELAKQLAMNLQQSGADPTDMARLMHEASQPNTTQGKQAIVTLAAEQIGYQRLRSAQYLEFQARHPNDANNNTQFYNQETGDWAGQQDPMAYAADLIPQAELSSYIRGLDKDGQTRFAQSLQNAKRLFKFQLPTQQGGQNGG